MVYKVLILGVQNQRLQENLKRVAWELDVGQEDRTRINHLLLAQRLQSPILLCFDDYKTYVVICTCLLF